jgi:hypothetical protein
LGTVVFLKRGYIGNKIRETKQWYPKAKIYSSASRGYTEDYTPKERGVTSKNVVGHQNCDHHDLRYFSDWSSEKKGEKKKGVHMPKSSLM